MSVAEDKDPLSSMSLEELWELFPIILVEPQEKWEHQYQVMKARVEDALRAVADPRISHVGSTAISGIWAKDIVDILVEVGSDDDIEMMAQALEHQGFIRMRTEPHRVSLNYGYTPQGFAENVYHLHVRVFGDNDELYFRDYLNENPEVAQEYQALKLSIWKQYEHDRDAYTDAKAAFVRKCTEEARRIYGKRYGECEKGRWPSENDA